MTEREAREHEALEQELAHKTFVSVVARRLLYAVAAATTAAMLVLLVVLAAESRHEARTSAEISADTDAIVRSIEAQQDSMRNSLHEIRRLTKLVRDCTTPGDTPCARRSDRRTAAAVGNIGHIIVLAVACTNRPDVDPSDPDQIEACMSGYLREGPR